MMKTKYTILSLLLAAASTAGAQTSGSAATPAVPTAPTAATARVAVRAGARAATNLTAAGTDVVIPTVKIDQVEAPVEWTYSDDLGSTNITNAGVARMNSGPVTFLGVSTNPPSQELSTQLAVPADTGLVVDFVTPGSPAEKAGVQNSDVLTKLDDQILILPRQLAVLVANHKEGDSVKISLIRKGQPQEITATLGKQESTMSGISADLAAKLGDVRILVDGKEQQPLRTFTRRFAIPAEGVDPAAPSSNNAGGTASGATSGSFGGSGTNARIPSQVLDALKHSLNQARIARGDSDKAMEDADEAAKSVREELKDMRRMLEDLNKKLEEQKK
ncbi:MAG: htrA [Akkermansiaceae bacterium]|nr:htrA [Akkermansiaceae bacterium]